MQQIVVYACVNRYRTDVRGAVVQSASAVLGLRPRDETLLDSSSSVRMRSRDVTRGDGVDLLAGGS